MRNKESLVYVEARQIFGAIHNRHAPWSRQAVRHGMAIFVTH